MLYNVDTVSIVKWQPATGPYPHSLLTSGFFKIYFNIILQSLSTVGLRRGLFLSGFLIKNSYQLLIHACYKFWLFVLLDLIIRCLEGGCKLWSSTSCIFLRHPHTSFLLRQNIFLLILFPHTLRIWSTLLTIFCSIAFAFWWWPVVGETCNDTLLYSCIKLVTLDGTYFSIMY